MDGKPTLHEFLLSLGQLERVEKPISVMAAGRMTIVEAPTSQMSDMRSCYHRFVWTRRAGMQH
jgi:hypothetical protein